MAAAQAKCNLCAKKTDFFDFEYAKSMWSELQTHEQFWVEWNRVYPVAKAAYDEGILEGHPEQVREQIADRPDAIEIMQGYDLWVAREKVFIEAWPLKGNCAWVEALNIFTHQCDDMPDWRFPEQVARSKERRERVAKENATRVDGSR